MRMLVVEDELKTAEYLHQGLTAGRRMVRMDFTLRVNKPTTW